MPTKPSDLLNRIPTAAELLDKPPIRALADRWNRSVVAAGVRSFLDELRADLQRRAADAQLPSLRELAERAARYVAAMQQPAERPTINATGRIFGPPWVHAPLNESALERMFALGRDFVAAAEPPAPPSLAGDFGPLVHRIVPAQAAAAIHSYAGAVWLTLAALAERQEVLVSRAELGDVDAGRPLTQLATSAGAVLTEVGTTNRTLAADYEAAIVPRTAALLRLHPDGYRVVGETERAEIEELIALARDRELVLIEALGAAPLVELPSSLGLARRSVQQSRAAGVDLVLVRGDGLVGGPPCGLIIGSRELVNRIADHPLYAAWQLDPLRTAALSATLERYASAPSGALPAPTLQLLSTPLENLRDRAERLAPQLAQSPGIAATEAVAVRSQLFITDPPECHLPSYGIALAPSSGRILDLENQLAGAAPPVFGRRQDDRLVLDLRTVFPRQDQLLVEAIAAGKPANSSEGR